MSGIEPEKFEFESEETEKQTTGKEGTVVERRKKLAFDTEDIVAIAAGMVAVLFAIGMIAGKLPVNRLTISIAGFTLVGATIAKIMKSKQATANAKKKK